MLVNQLSEAGVSANSSRGMRHENSRCCSVSSIALSSSVPAIGTDASGCGAIASPTHSEGWCSQNGQKDGYHNGQPPLLPQGTQFSAQILAVRGRLTVQTSDGIDRLHNRVDAEPRNREGNREKCCVQHGQPTLRSRTLHAEQRL